MVVLVVLGVLVIAGVVAGVVVGRSKRRAVDRRSGPDPDVTAARLSFDAVAADVPSADGDGDAAARFRPVGERSSSATALAAPATPSVVVRHLEATPSIADELAPVIVPPDEPIAEPDTGRDPKVDEVVSALIDRVRSCAGSDVVAVVSEMVERDLNTDQMEEVLGHLIERRAGLPERDELALSGPDVPQRPGRLSAFGHMDEGEKRRVIIRVLCLLIARSEDQVAGDVDERPLHTVELPQPDALAASDAAEAPTARDLWGEPDGDFPEAHLPARRRRLARSRR